MDDAILKISSQADKVDALVYSLETAILDYKGETCSKEFQRVFNLFYCLMDQVEKLKTEVAEYT